MLGMQKTKSGFTIVEILIVIVVIAILAAVVLVAYNGVREGAVDSMLRSSLSSVAQKLEVYNVKHSSYPGDLEEVGIVDTDTVRYQYDGPSGSNGYCLSVTSPRSVSLAYHSVSGDTSPRDGVCEGHAGPGEEEGEEVFSFARTVRSEGPLGLTISVGEEWDAAEISWTPQGGAKRYEVQSRNPTGVNNSSTRNFNYRNISNGSGVCYVGSSCSVGVHTHNIPSNTTSLTWTNTSYAVPASAGQSFDYRIRYTKADDSLSEWEEVSIANPIQSSNDLRTPRSFTVKPNASYTNVTLSWDQVPNFTPKMSEVFYEVQSRNPTGVNNTSTRNFQYRNISDGSGHCISCVVGTHSHAIPFDTTSLTWTNTSYAVPSSVGQNFEYQFRVRVSGERNFYSEWSDTVTVSHPIQSNSDVPSVSNFTVTPNASYTNVTLSWDQVPNFTPKMSEVFYEVQSRNPTGVNNTSTRNFQYRNISDGGSHCIASLNCVVGTHSHAIPFDTTSLTWTNTSYGVPSAAGQSFEYQMRIRAAGERTFYSDWSPVVTVSH